jgi:hypothetical protein
LIPEGRDILRRMALAAGIVLAALGLLHVYWGVVGLSPGPGTLAIPEVAGRPAFRPGRLASLAVAAALFAASFLVLARGPFAGAVPPKLGAVGAAGVGVVFLLRAIGDFRLVGFFKRVRGTPFARWDNRLFSPLCLALGLASLWVARPLPGGTPMPDSPAAARIDHILVGAADLDSARTWLAKAAGVDPVYGGKHPTGTHNALLSLGQGTYLELIAPQPGTPPRSPYGDFTGLTTPQPIGFAVAGGAIEPLRRRLEAAGFALTAPEAGSRVTPAGATLRWQTFGVAREFAQAPFFIVWSADTPHPSTTSPAGCTLRRRGLGGPAHAELEGLRAARDRANDVSPAAKPSFEVELDCPAGPVTLRNSA